MRLPGRIAAAIEVLADIEARKRPVSEALKAWGLNNRFAGAGDLGTPDVRLPIEDLAVEVGQLDPIRIEQGDAVDSACGQSEPATMFSAPTRSRSSAMSSSWNGAIQT